MTSINQIAKSLKINAKNARRILRKAKNVPAVVASTRWTWETPSEVAQVKKILKAA